jgi:predicted membrane-bound spermidine synthase
MTVAYLHFLLIEQGHVLCLIRQALIIDGKMQSTEVDEFIYHESLIHPPLLFHPK